MLAYEKDTETLRIDLSNTQANLKESTLQFTHKSKEFATLKSELLTTQKCLTEAEQQVIFCPHHLVLIFLTGEGQDRCFFNVIVFPLVTYKIC